SGETAGVIDAIAAGSSFIRRDMTCRRLIIMNRQPQLFEVILTLSSPSRLSRLLDGRQKKTDQNSDDRNDNQQLNQGETALASPLSRHGSAPSLNHVDDLPDPCGGACDSSSFPSILQLRNAFCKHIWKLEEASGEASTRRGCSLA